MKMNRNGKQVLLKYNTVERTCEDGALMLRLKSLVRWFFLTALLFFPFMFYVPLYFDGSSKEVIYGWEANVSRSIPLYVTPDNDTTLIDGGHICSEPLELLVMVCSAPGNTHARAAIRETWANFTNPGYKVVFMLGTTENATLQEAIEREASTHHDVIQENFIDSYNNLTLKSVMMLKYVKSRCDRVRFIFKSDDDMFAYIPNILAFVRLARERRARNLLVGWLFCNVKPILELNNKWFSPRYMYRAEYYPHYLSGPGYLMDRLTALRLYDAALVTPFFHLEDVYVTGLCALKAKIKPRHHPGFTYVTRPLDPCIYLRNQNMFTSHRVTLDNMRKLWAALKNDTVCPGAKKPARLDYNIGKRNKCS